MKYFRVEEEYIGGVVNRVEVCRDGEWVGEPYEVRNENEIKRITTGYTVYVEDEDSMTQDVEFYPVKTNMNSWGFSDNNSAEVLAQIEADHPAGEWENFSW